MESELIDMGLHEQLRRAKIAVDFARTELQRARDVEAMLARGIAVADGERANVAALEQTLAEREQHAGNLRAMLDDIEAEQQREQAEREAEEARQRKLAVAAADKRLLASRRALDIAYTDRLAAARDAGDKVYAQKVDAHLQAQQEALAAHAARAALEADDE